MPAELVRRNINIVKLSEQAKARFDATFAIEVTDALKAPGSLWPVLTGFSKDRFIAEDDTQGNILVFNTAHYARWLEYGRKSPHRGSARRTINAAMAQILNASWKEANNG